MRIKELAGSSICSHREMSDYLTGRINSDRADNGASGPENPAAGEICSNSKAQCKLILILEWFYYSKLNGFWPIQLPFESASHFSPVSTL